MAGWSSLRSTPPCRATPRLPPQSSEERFRTCSSERPGAADADVRDLPQRVIVEMERRLAADWQRCAFGGRRSTLYVPPLRGLSHLHSLGFLQCNDAGTGKAVYGRQRIAVDAAPSLRRHGHTTVRSSRPARRATRTSFKPDQSSRCCAKIPSARWRSRLLLSCGAA